MSKLKSLKFKQNINEQHFSTRLRTAFVYVGDAGLGQGPLSIPTYWRLVKGEEKEIEWAIMPETESVKCRAQPRMTFKLIRRRKRGRERERAIHFYAGDHNKIINLVTIEGAKRRMRSDEKRFTNSSPSEAAHFK